MRNDGATRLKPPGNTYAFRLPVVVEHPDDFRGWTLLGFRPQNARAYCVSLRARSHRFGEEMVTAYCNHDVYRVARETGVLV